MIGFFRKLHHFGYRRAFIYVLIRCAIGTKVWLYRYFLSDNAPKMYGVKLMTPTQFVGKGGIKISNAQLGVWPSPHLFSSGYLEARNTESCISIGEGTVINNNFSIIADKSEIQIGRRCLIGPNFFCTDSDFHGLEVSKRGSPDYYTGNVLIEDDVFIGEGVKVMKEVRIGCGAVIAAGSVVIKNIDPFSVYAGIPAKKISSLKELRPA